LKHKLVILRNNNNRQLDRIMLVDDNMDIIKTFKSALEDNEFIVEGFFDPFKALEKFRSSPEGTFKLLMIDLRLDGYGIDGFKLYQEMKNSGKELPRVCFITAYQDYYDDLRISYPGLEIQCFIRKPIRNVDLVARIKQELQES
jgi:DNA-binding response OmpR family regulator